MSREVPGELAGGAEGTTVTADSVYSNTRTLWVEPTTGSIVNGQEQIRQFFRGPDGEQGVTLLAGTLNFTPEAVTGNAGLARDGRSLIVLLTTTLPIVLGAVGLILLAGGAFLLARGAGRNAPTVPLPRVGAQPRAAQRG
jgi:hypothetical protein